MFSTYPRWPINKWPWRLPLLLTKSTQIVLVPFLLKLSKGLSESRYLSRQPCKCNYLRSHSWSWCCLWASSSRPQSFSTLAPNSLHLSFSSLVISLLSTESLKKSFASQDCSRFEALLRNRGILSLSSWGPYRHQRTVAGCRGLFQISYPIALGEPKLSS